MARTRERARSIGAKPLFCKAPGHVSFCLFLAPTRRDNASIWGLSARFCFQHVPHRGLALHLSNQSAALRKINAVREDAPTLAHNCIRARYTLATMSLRAILAEGLLIVMVREWLIGNPWGTVWQVKAFENVKLWVPGIETRFSQWRVSGSQPERWFRES